MAKVISRFSVSSKSDEVNFLDVAASLPNSYKKLIQKGHPVILNNGKNTGRIENLNLAFRPNRISKLSIDQNLT